MPLLLHISHVQAANRQPVEQLGPIGPLCRISGIGHRQPPSRRGVVAGEGLAEQPGNRAQTLPRQSLTWAAWRRSPL
jgi:hypothetical protein